LFKINILKVIAYLYFSALKVSRKQQLKGMNILKSIDKLRRRLMHNLTKNIGNKYPTQNIDLNKKNAVKRILICRPNHRLGNLLLITPLLQEVIATFPNCKIDLFIKGNLGSIIFKNYKNIENIIKLPRKPFKELINYFKVWISIKKQPYDLVINVVSGSSSGKLAAQFSNSKYKFFGNVDEDIKSQYDNFEHIAKKPIYSLRNYLNKFGIVESNKEIPSINLKLSPSEITEGQKIVKELVNDDKKTICIFTYATDDKCYSESWWLNFYEKLKTAFSDYNILEVLPVENISMINFKAPSFYSKDIREIASVIANTEVFIGADSGIMHLASSALIPTVGLFSRANQNEYQPYNNKSIAVNTNNINDIECFKIVKNILVN